MELNLKIYSPNKTLDMFCQLGQLPYCVRKVLFRCTAGLSIREGAFNLDMSTIKIVKGKSPCYVLNLCGTCARNFVETPSIALI